VEWGRAAIKIKIFTDDVTLVSQFELEGPENRAKKSSYTPEQPLTFTIVNVLIN